MAANRKYFGRGGRLMLAVVPLACVLLPAVGRTDPSTAQATSMPDIVASHSAVPVGAPSPNQVMHLVVSLPLRNGDQIDAAIRDLYDPQSAGYKHYLSVAEFTDRFGPSEQDYATARRYFSQHGFAVGPHAANRYLISLDGKVSDVERVFHVTMNLYRHPTENRMFYSADRLPTFDLDTPIQEIIGLDDFERPYNRLVRADVEKDAGGSGPGGHFTGGDMRAAYYPSGTLTGRGQSVGLMELAGVNVRDVKNFFAQKYGPANNVHIELIKTDSEPVTCTGNCSDGEQALDIEYTISMAPGLSSVRVYIGSSPEDVLNAMASDNISKVLSTSWGWHKQFATDDGLFQEFALQGQTNLTASGDYSSLIASGPWPEEDRYIVAVGGTDLYTVTPGGPWLKEAGWSGSAGGPSVDSAIHIEPYQLPYVNAENGGSTTLRDVPDIAANANTNMVLCADGGCFSGGGGTSFASPIWAGFIALANEQAIAHGQPVVGFINPRMYSTLGHSANYTDYFHDIKHGTSGVFNCTPGYDLVTGLGSPTGQTLIDALID